MRELIRPGLAFTVDARVGDRPFQTFDFVCRSLPIADRSRAGDDRLETDFPVVLALSAEVARPSSRNRSRSSRSESRRYLRVGGFIRFF